VTTFDALNSDEKASLIEHFKTLQNRVFEIESRFDNALLLVAGGAFTVSAAVVQNLAEATAGGALISAWCSWAVCLTLCVGGHLLSTRCHNRQLSLMAAEKYDQVGSRDFGDRCIPWTNYGAFFTLIVGFIAFGVFTFSNINFGGADGQGKEERKEESVEAASRRLFDDSSESTSPTHQSIERTGRATGISEGKEREVIHERQEANDAATGATSIPEGRAAQDAGQNLPGSAAGQRDQRAEPAAGVSETEAGQRPAEEMKKPAG
jgi:hypothetical protein